MIVLAVGVGVGVGLDGAARTAGSVGIRFMPAVVRLSG
jgi:hypothetical protein